MGLTKYSSLDESFGKPDQEARTQQLRWGLDDDSYSCQGTPLPLSECGNLLNLGDQHTRIIATANCIGGPIWRTSSVPGSWKKIYPTRNMFAAVE